MTTPQTRTKRWFIDKVPRRAVRWETCAEFKTRECARRWRRKLESMDHDYEYRIRDARSKG